MAGNEIPNTPNDHDKQLDAVLDELESVIGDMHAFLPNFCERLQQFAMTLPIAEGVPNEACIVPEDRESWESKREQVEQSLREQVDLLANAWLRLEEEQRSLLQLKSGQSSVSTTQVAIKAVSDQAAGRQCIPGSSRMSRQHQPAAVSEFERLRREIQSSRPQNNGK